MVQAGAVLQTHMEVSQHNLLVLVGLLLGAALHIQALMQEQRHPAYPPPPEEHSGFALGIQSLSPSRQPITISQQEFLGRKLLPGFDE